jgi:hypothetical protein
MMPLSNTTSSFGSFVYIVSAITMGTMLYLVLSVLAINILSLVFQLSPKTLGVSTLLLTFLIVGGGILNSWKVQVTHQEIAIKGITEKVSAMHLSDIHIGHFRGKKFLQNIVEKTNRENVDVVFITGDLFDGKINLNYERIGTFKRIRSSGIFC